MRKARLLSTVAATLLLSAEDRELMRDMTFTINAFFGWDFNSCEALSQGGTWHPIDFANAIAASADLTDA